MGSLKSLAQGFLVATGLIWLFNIASLFRGGDAWLVMLYLLVLLIPVSSVNIPQTQKHKPKKPLRKLSEMAQSLFSFQGVALAFWMFDIATTFYAINVTGLAIELNPLGWPLGILGAFAYYAPTLVFSYILLFKIKDKTSLYAAIPLTLLTLGMSSMNLMAGAQNFQVFVDTATLAAGIRYEMLALIVAVNLAVPLTLKRMVTQPKSGLNLKNS